jgi:LysM repeat protein
MPLYKIAQRLGVSLEELKQEAYLLEQKGLLLKM